MFSLQFEYIADYFHLMAFAQTKLVTVLCFYVYQEIVTSAEFHPLHCNLLAYSSSRGFIRLVDMRQSALCDDSAIL